MEKLLSSAPVPRRLLQISFHHESIASALSGAFAGTGASSAPSGFWFWAFSGVPSGFVFLPPLARGITYHPPTPTKKHTHGLGFFLFGFFYHGCFQFFLPFRGEYIFGEREIFLYLDPPPVANIFPNYSKCDFTYCTRCPPPLFLFLWRYYSFDLNLNL